MGYAFLASQSGPGRRRGWGRIVVVVLCLLARWPAGLFRAQVWRRGGERCGEKEGRMERRRESEEREEEEGGNEGRCVCVCVCSLVIVR